MSLSYCKIPLEWSLTPITMVLNKVCLTVF